MIKIHCEVPVHEVDGQSVDSNAKDKPVIVVESDWRQTTARTYVVLTIGGKKYTVDANDIATAVGNASTR